MKTFNNIDSYINAAPEQTRSLLREMRELIRAAAPQAQEAISYGIPTYKLNGNLVHFGGFKGHVSFFPTASGVSAFESELSRFQISKGTVQFPLDEPLPRTLIQKIVRFRVKENGEKHQTRKKQKR